MFFSLFYTSYWKVLLPKTKWTKPEIRIYKKPANVCFYVREKSKKLSVLQLYGVWGQTWPPAEGCGEGPGRMVRKQVSAQGTVTLQWAYLYFCWKFLTEMLPWCVWVAKLYKNNARKGRDQSTLCSVANTCANTHKCSRGENDSRDGIYVNYTALRIV